MNNTILIDLSKLGKTSSESFDDEELHTLRQNRNKYLDKLEMEYFTTVLVVLGVSVVCMHSQGLLNWVTLTAVIVVFCVLIKKQREDVKQQKRDELAGYQHSIEAYAERMSRKHEFDEWLREEMDKLYGEGRDPTGEKFIRYANLFTVTATLDKGLLDELSLQNDGIVNRRRTKPLKLSKLYDQLNIEMTYNSNAIEGNTITRSETAMILSGILSLEQRRTMREVFDIDGHAQAFQAVRSLVSSKEPIGIGDILRIHALVLQRHSYAGKFRTDEDHVVTVGYKRVLLAMPDETEALMSKFVAWLADRTTKDHPFVLACYVHYILVRIHPFVDGNGRTARLMSNLVLMRGGYPAIIVPVGKTDEYFDKLGAWDGGDPAPFIKFMAEVMEEMFHFYELNLLC